MHPSAHLNFNKALLMYCKFLLLCHFHSGCNSQILYKGEYLPNSTIKKSLETMKRVCYYEIPSMDADNKFIKGLSPNHIDPEICTHLIIAFAHIQDASIVPSRETDIHIYSEVMKLKEINPGLKVMLSLSKGFPELVKSRKAIDLFAFNAHKYLVEHNFDGLDLDWEFPSWPRRLRNRHEKKQFTYLVEQLYTALKLSSHPPLLLSIAVAAPSSIVRSSYEIPQLSRNVDFVNLMGYDYRMYWPYFPFTGYNAPLFPSRKDFGYFRTLNIAWSTEYWISHGTPKEKLVVGIPTYGRTWKLLSFRWNGLGAPAVSKGIFQGYLTYPQALWYLRNGCVRVFDGKSRVPYCSLGRNWFSYEDRTSIYEKVIWIKHQNVAGVMVWNLNCDDFTGEESGRKFDLLRVIKETLQS